jgi:hypothetical protein
MTRRRRFLALFATLFAFPAFAAGPDRYAADPPLPSGPPIVVPASDTRKPTWLEDGPTIVPAGGQTAAPSAPGSAWPGGTSGSACNFDAPGCNQDWMVGQPTWTQVLAGAYFTVNLGPTIPKFNYVPISLRQGWYLGDPLGWNWLGQGYWEFVGDITGAAITSDYGSYFAGLSLIWRFNWCNMGSPLIPYTQFGAGGVLNDAYRNQMQQAVGEQFEFYLHAECGLKCFVTPNLSLDIEGGLQHISNGGLARRNYGVNAMGGTIGFTYYFPWGCH